jgi:MFS family permease
MHPETSPSESRKIAVASEKASLEAPASSEAPTSDGEDYSVLTLSMRRYLTYLLGFTIITSTLTATIYFPLIPLLSTHFSVSIQAINLTVTVYAIFQAISPVFFASLADIFGRRPVLLGLISLYACASLGLALNKQSYAALVALRALQSIGGSATVPISYGIVADVAVVSERGKMLGPMLATCNGISAVGPVIGGAISLRSGGFAWVFLGLLIVAVISLLLIGFTLPETARGVVGNGRQQTHGIWRPWLTFIPGRKKQSNDGSEASKNPVQEGRKRTWKLLTTALFASLRIILFPDATAVLWMVAWSYSVYYTIQVAIPVIFKEVYGYNELEIGLAFLPGLAGMTIGCIIAGKRVDRNYVKTAAKYNVDVDRKKGDNLKDFPIEIARYRGVIPVILLEIALLVSYGWVVHSHVHASVPLIMQFFICGTSTFLSHTASTLLVDIFPDRSSTAYAAGQIMRCGLSAASVAVLQPLVNKVGRGWYFTIFALFVGISCLAAILTSKMKGMQWRQKRQAVVGETLGANLKS